MHNLTGIREIFRLRDFRLLWLSVLVSQVGDWMQITTQGWLVVEITDSPAAVAFVAACGIMPQLIFVLIGGVVADRYEKRQLMLVLVLLQFLTSATLTAFVVSGLRQVWVLALFSFMLGTAAALWQPIYISFIPSLVPTSRLNNAMGMSLTCLYLARTMGPILASGAIAVIGTRNTYLFNTISFLAPIYGLFLIRTRSHGVETARRLSLSDLWQSGRFIMGERLLLPLWLFSFFLSLGILPIFALLPVFVDDVLGMGVAGLGVLMGVSGLGQVFGALGTSMYSSKHDSGFGRHQVLGYVTMGLSICLFALSSSIFMVSLLSFGLFNFLHGLLSPRVNTIVQLRTDSAMRGRVQGFFLFTFSMVSLGQLMMGWCAERIDLRAVIAVPAFVFTLMGLGLFVFRSQLTSLRMRDGVLEVRASLDDEMNATEERT